MPDGLQQLCKECRRKRDREKYAERQTDPAWQAKERTRNRERMKAKRKADAAFYAAELAKRRARLSETWRTDPAFRAKCRVRKRAKYATDASYRARVSARNSRWATSERGQHAARIREARRRQRERANGGDTLTVEDWRFVIQLQEGLCACCRKPLGDHPCRDHILSVMHGGTLTLTNTQAMCKSCNSAKHGKSVDYRTPTHRALTAWVAGEAEFVPIG